MRNTITNAQTQYKMTKHTCIIGEKRKPTHTHTKTHLKPINNLNENAIDKTLKVNHSLIVKGQ